MATSCRNVALRFLPKMWPEALFIVYMVGMCTLLSCADLSTHGRLFFGGVSVESAGVTLIGVEGQASPPFVVAVSCEQSHGLGAACGFASQSVDDCVLPPSTSPRPSFQ